MKRLTTHKTCLIAGKKNTELNQNLAKLMSADKKYKGRGLWQCIMLMREQSIYHPLVSYVKYSIVRTIFSSLVHKCPENYCHTLGGIIVHKQKL